MGEVVGLAQVFRKGQGSGKRKWLPVIAIAAVMLLGVGVFAFVSNEGSGVVVERSEKALTEDASTSGTGEASSALTDGEGSSSVGTAGSAATSSGVVLVHVDGAVAAPGVYELAMALPHVNDAVQAAGGLTEEADTSGVNLAAAVTDGSKVHIPAQAEAQQSSEITISEQGSSSSGGSVSSGLVNINTATADELDVLPGVGPSTAATIVEDRERNGPFSSVEDLMRVSGIGEKKFAKLQGSICV